jgi:hypothetical protein
MPLDVLPLHRIQAPVGGLTPKSFNPRHPRADPLPMGETSNGRLDDVVSSSCFRQLFWAVSGRSIFAEAPNTSLQ